MAQMESQVTALRDTRVRMGLPRMAHHRRQRRQLQPPFEIRPELQAAVDGGVVTLDVLIEARRLGRAGADARERAAYSHYWPLLLDLYQQANGRLVEQFFAKQIDAAAVLTDRAELRMTYPAEKVVAVQPEFEEALWRAAAMVRQAKELLDGRTRMILLRSLHSLLVYLLGVLDSLEPVFDSEERKHRIQAALTCAKHELDRNQAYLDQASLAAAQKRYLLGMPLGVLVVAGLVLVVGRMQVKDVDVRTALIILVAGGVGAVVSVMARMTRGDLTIDSDASRLIIWFGGFFRPILGAILALALYALILAALVPIAKPESGDQLAFFGGIAFLAGFSERWAQDMLVRTTRGIGTETPRTRSIVPSSRHRQRADADPD
jgi:hypothetical protein